MSSLERLIDLARTTGDRLIVHNAREGGDLVVLPLHEYERLIAQDTVGYRRAHALSSDQLLDQINRDIAVWRAEQDNNMRHAYETALHKELEQAPPFDPFSDIPCEKSPWETPDDIFKQQYKELYAKKVSTAVSTTDTTPITRIPYTDEVHAELDKTEDEEDPILLEELIP